MLSEGGSAGRWAVKLEFVGADPDVQPVGEDPQQAVFSYFRGSPEEWHTNLPTYGRIIYRDLWPGITLVYTGTVNELKYEFLVARPRPRKPLFPSWPGRICRATATRTPS